MQEIYFILISKIIVKEILIVIKSSNLKINKKYFNFNLMSDDEFV